ncbi:ArsR/SmtB family transcription factor [Streptomyces sp. NPDC058877]|uniref:ArsR/SmtB family transcription factor n=1 Tax=Streptomyces sp. NPDC058877 TaxID=3346665 RepID=UPI0036CF642D
MLRVRFTSGDFARVRFAPRPSPVAELHAALMMMGAPHEELLFGRWRGRLLRALPRTAEPLADLVPGGTAPRFLDVLGETREEGIARVRAARPEFVRSELERVYGAGRRPVPPWIRALHTGSPDAWRVWERAQRAAYETVLAPVWSRVQDLHRAEFARHALVVAEQGLGAALAALAPGLRDGVWEWPGAAPREVRLAGRGLVLLPTFHWRGGPLLQDLPDRPVVLAYPAGGALPLTGSAGTAEAVGDGHEEALAGVLGRTRAALLRTLAEPRTTTELARCLGVSNATASAHAQALRAAGLLTTTRTGRSVRHAVTPLGALLASSGG